MPSIVFPLVSLFSVVLAGPTPQGGPFTGLCGIPFLDSLTCINGSIVGPNLPTKELTCKFTLAATRVGGPNTPYAIGKFDPSNPTIAGFGVSGQTLQFEIHQGVLFSNASLRGEAAVLRATPASGSSEKFSIVDDGGVVPDLAIKYKCLKGLPALVVVPEVGDYFDVDPRAEGTYDEGSWYSAAVGQTDPFHTFKEIDVVVSLIYS